MKLDLVGGEFNARRVRMLLRQFAQLGSPFLHVSMQSPFDRLRKEVGAILAPRIPGVDRPQQNASPVLLQTATPNLLKGDRGDAHTRMTAPDDLRSSPGASVVHNDRTLGKQAVVLDLGHG